MSTALQLRKDTAANCAAYSGPVGECVVDTTNRRLLIHDGLTEGGIPANGVYGQFGSFIQPEVVEGAIETLPIGNSNYSTSLLIPAGCLLLAVGYTIKIAITGCTTFELGIAGTLALFGSGLGAGVGGTVLPVAPQVFAAATPLVLTSTAGGNFTAGALRFAVYYLAFGPPAT